MFVGDKFQMRKTIQVIILSCCFLLVSTILWAADFQRVLLISSYHPGFPTFFQQVEGMKAIFDGKPILFDIEFMDTKRFPGRDTVDAFQNYLGKKISQLPPYDVILVADDNALNFALENQQTLFPERPIVFLGVSNIDLALQQNQNPYVTGFVEAVSMKETLDLMRQLHPQAKRFVALVDGLPSSWLEMQCFFHYREQFPEIDFETLLLAELSFEEFADQLKNLKKTDVVLLLAAYRDKEGMSLHFHESLKLITDNLSQPLYHLWSHGMGDGVLGGKLVNHKEFGKSAAKLAMDILNGQPVQQVMVKLECDNEYFFDAQQLKRFGIRRSALPAGSRIVNGYSLGYLQY